MKQNLNCELSLYISSPESHHTVLITSLRILNSMAKQEWFASDTLSIVCSSSVEGSGWVPKFVTQTLDWLCQYMKQMTLCWEIKTIKQQQYQNTSFASSWRSRCCSTCKCIHMQLICWNHSWWWVKLIHHLDVVLQSANTHGHQTKRNSTTASLASFGIMLIASCLQQKSLKSSCLRPEPLNVAMDQFQWF